MNKFLFVIKDEAIKKLVNQSLELLENVEFSITEDFEQAEIFLNENKVVALFSQFTSKFDGFNFIKRVQLTNQNTYRIIITDDSTKSKIPYLINHVHKVLRFPFDINELIKLIEHYSNLSNYDLSLEVINKINSMGTVPVLPDIYLKLERELLKNEVSVSRVAEIVGTDSYVTGQIMRIVYSSFYNISTNTLSVLHAINFLGLDIVKSLVLYVKIFSIKNVKPYTAAHLKNLREHSIKVAKLSKAIMNSECQDRELHDSAFTAGLLHDIGKIVLIHFNDKHLVAEDFNSNSEFNLINNEIEYFGVDHLRIGTYLLNLWNFPKEIINAVKNHHNKEIINNKNFNLSQSVFIANSLINNIQENIDLIKDIFGEEKLNYWNELVPNGETISYN